MADDESTQPATQQILDPRRIGLNNSGLDDQDIADVLCILHPSSKGALRVVEDTADTKPHYVLSRDPFGSFGEHANLDAQQTLIIEKSLFSSGSDLALRMSAPLISPSLGFVFGRNVGLSDIVFSHDTGKRISNRHFRIYLNRDGILMIEDMSTNGTIVDNTMLKCKDPNLPSNRMLESGSIINVASVGEGIKFIVRIPSRDGHRDQYEANVQAFFNRCHPVQAPVLVNRHQGDRHWKGGDKYNFICQLGKGAFATVYQIATKMEGKLYAAKELEKRKFVKNGRLDKKIDNEMQIMKGLEHPNIVKFVDFHDEGDYLYIVMEFVPHGDLQGHLHNNGALREAQARTMARQILDAMAYLHRQNITHRDIKPDNILIMSQDPFTVKLSDFGLSKVVEDNSTFLKTFCGTLLYCAPEVFPDFEPPRASLGTKRRRGPSQRYHSYGSSVDIWSFAAVLWYSLCKEPPFEGIADHTGRAMYNNIMSTILDPTPLRQRRISNDCIDVLLKMLQTDPARRPTEHECLRHPWLFDGTLLPDDPALGSIIEEEEGDSPDKAGQQFSQLSITEDQPGYDDLGEIVESDLDLDDEDLDFFSGRTSKRIRSDRLFPRNQLREPRESSVDASVYEGALGSMVEESFPPAPAQPARLRLFGEIGESALESPGMLSAQVHEALSNQGSGTGKHTSGRPRGKARGGGVSLRTRDRPAEARLGGVFSSPSLLGAESMVRELNMASPQSHTSGGRSSNEPATPKTPDGTQYPSLENVSQVSEPTPKPKVPPFSRQISLPKTPSFFYDPYDPTTHTLEYASKVSGIDFVGEARAQAAREAENALPDTMYFSPNAERANQENGSTDSVPDSTAGSPIKAPRRRLGKLVSTSDSINPNLVVWIDQPRTSFGRLFDNTLVWENKMDTRIPKKAFTVWWESDISGQVDSYDQQGEDWSDLEGLRSGIFTSARAGIFVNGIHLQTHNPSGRFCYGHLHHGDVIQVFQNGKETLRFRCEFYYGAGKDPRPTGKQFKVELGVIDPHFNQDS